MQAMWAVLTDSDAEPVAQGGLGSDEPGPGHRGGAWCLDLLEGHPGPATPTQCVLGRPVFVF